MVDGGNLYPSDNACYRLWVISFQLQAIALLYDVRQISHNKQFVVETSVPKVRTLVLTTNEHSYSA
ncbi:MAG: hypothetical protein KME40_02305 [Komarekiella atlantica HA4396-MV6]|jgi:hypothetical protein|nr:hypothetical protein [Komarekiella atlantica HA4396-MV6]